jgi:hypothetical protein
MLCAASPALRLTRGERQAKMVGTLEEAILRKLRGSNVVDLSPLDRKIIGGTEKHLILPLDDIYNVRRIIAIGHQLMTDLEMLSRRTDLSDRLIFLSLQDAVDTANREIRKICGKRKRTRHPAPRDY